MSAGRRGPSWRVAIAVMIAGALLAVPLVVRLASSVANVVTEESYETPARFTRHLDAGRYVVFERTGSRRRVGPVTVGNNQALTVAPGQVHVVGVDGAPLPATFDRAIETITRGDAVFTGAIVFDVTDPGEYEITVDGEGRDVLVARSLGETVRRLGRPFALASGGGLLFVLGLALLVVGIVRRRADERAPAAAAVAGGAPAGWYAAPEGAGRRYWDGTQWTEHTSQ
jgi:hypothetical protein